MKGGSLTIAAHRRARYAILHQIERGAILAGTLGFGSVKCGARLVLTPRSNEPI